MVRWVYRIGYRQFTRTLSGKGAGRARQAALSRCRVVGSLAFGASLIDACAMAGFKSVDNWIESCKGSSFFPSLRAARRDESQHLPSVRQLRQLMRAHAVQASDSIRALRAASGLWSSATLPSVRNVTVQSGASSVHYVPCGFRVVHPAASRSIVARGVTGTLVLRLCHMGKIFVCL
jgi:hypothetical protein